MKKKRLIVLTAAMMCGMALSIIRGEETQTGEYFISLNRDRKAEAGTPSDENQSGKYIIAFNGFNNQGNIDDNSFRVISSTLGNALKNELEKSGRFEVWDSDTLKDILKTKGNVELFDCKGGSSEQCQNRLAAFAKADYSAFATLSKSVSGDTYNISIKLNRVPKGKDLPQFDTESANNVAQFNLEITIREWCQTFIRKVPLKGTIRVRDKKDDRYVIINLGKDHKIMPGDTFIVKKEESGFTRTIGKLKVEKENDIQNDRSRAFIMEEIKKEKLWGDEIVVLDDSVRLNRMIEEENKKRKAEKMKSYKSSSDDSYKTILSSWDDGVNKRYTMFRAGFGGLGLTMFGDNSLNKLYNNSKAIGLNLDWYYSRFRNDNGNGVDLDLRFNYRKYQMKSGDAAKMYFSDIGSQLLFGSYSVLLKSPATVEIYSLGIFGLRYSFGFYFGERLDFYITAVAQLNWVTDKSKTKTNKYFSPGLIAGIGMELSFFQFMGMFVEYNYGYSPIGIGKKNINGHQLYYGATVRFADFFK